MSKPHFGMTFSQATPSAIAVLGGDFSKVLVIETSADADATKYPLDTFVRISTSDDDAVAKLGTGLLADMIKGINSQLTDLNGGADVVVCRVDEGVDVAATCANIVAVLDRAGEIAANVGCTPRIVLAGRTSWRVDLDTTNPVVAALPAALGKLLAVAPVDVDDTSTANALDARETMNFEGMFPVGIAQRVMEGQSVVTRSGAARVVGLMIRNDNVHGGEPFHPFANQPIYGSVGISRPLPFSLLDGSTEGQQLLEGGVSIFVTGETGVDGSPADGGVLFIGTDHSATAAQTTQIHQYRAMNYLKVKMIKITREFLGKPITLDFTEAWLRSLQYMLRDHKAAGDILGFKLDFEPDRNSPENIRLGHLHVSVQIEPTTAFKLAEHEIGRYRPALDGLVQDLVTQLDTIAA
jgi:phage tail sheath protein FI